LASSVPLDAVLGRKGRARTNRCGIAEFSQVGRSDGR